MARVAPREPRGGLEITALPPEPVSTRPEYIAPKPSTLVESPLEWAGKGVLPGESISRYRKTPPAARQEPSATTHAEQSAKPAEVSAAPTFRTRSGRPGEAWEDAGFSTGAATPAEPKP